MSALLNEELDKLEDENLADDEDALFDAFTSWAESTGRPLYPHQEESLIELLSDSHVVVQTPTGSGKSMIGFAAHFVSLARGGRSYYTAPLKALVSEKFFELVDAFGAANVGMVTGDVSLNADAPIICCTAEILANMALREGSDIDTDMVVMDEFHFYSDPQRGWAWQVPLLEITDAQFVFLSATLGNSDLLREEITQRTERPAALVSAATRPVPLEFEYMYEPLDTAVEQLIKEDRAPIYIVHFAQNDAVKTAVDLSRTLKVPMEQQKEIRALLRGTELRRGFGKTLRDLLSKGIAVHHAGMLPRYRRAVERLAQNGLLQVICGTDTLGVGINVPIRTVLFTSLVKYDGRRERHLSAREFHQISGRAGRPGFDPVGFVRAIATEQELDQVNRKAKMDAAKEAGDAKKKRKLARQRPKGRKDGELTWTKSTFERLTRAEPEVLHPRFTANHAMILNVLQGEGDPEERLLRLATEARHGHEQEVQSNRFLRDLGDIFRSLLQAGLVERQTQKDGSTRIVVVGDLPDEFALNQPLAPFALAALDLLDPDSATYALDVISVVESVMEDPRPLLFAQQRMARDEAFQTLRQEGFDFEERRDMVAEITWPKPLEELIMPAFETFTRTNPWVKGREPHPKRVLREMVEEGLTFSTLVSKYKLENSEGVILRYLTDIYRALRQILPEEAHTEEVEQITEWLRELLASVDSSLLSEWEEMLEGTWQDKRGEETVSVADAELSFGETEDGLIDFAVNPHALRIDIRNAMFRALELASRDDTEALAIFGNPLRSGGRDFRLNGDEWHEALGDYWDEHEYMRIDQGARASELAIVQTKPEQIAILDLIGSEDPDDIPLTKGGDTNWWIGRQVVLDPAETGEWHLVFLVDAAESVALRDAQVTPVYFGHPTELG